MTEYPEQKVNITTSQEVTESFEGMYEEDILAHAWLKPQYTLDDHKTSWSIASNFVKISVLSHDVVSITQKVQ